MRVFGSGCRGAREGGRDGSGGFGLSKLPDGAEPPPPIGLGRVVKAFGYSMAGLRAAWLTQGAFRQEVLIAAVLLPVAFLAPVPPLERVLLAASVLFVMVVELLNSAVEATVDRISRDIHPLSGYAKDVGSAAVMLALVIAAMVWLAIMGPVVVGWFG